jgi:hypothetical protein
MVSGETIISDRAKNTYDGAIMTLNSANRAIGADAVTDISHCQISTTGATDTQHTRVWTVTSDATVQAMRQATTARDGPVGELTGITGFSDA